MNRPTICLNMIVKNEAHVIERCLASARPLIDAWCIVDTGSSDGTQGTIRALMAGIPGTLHERPWKNFGHNRTEALQLAHAQGCDYLLFIDADEWFDAPADFAWPRLADDAYELPCHYAGIVYARCALVATRLVWRWEGVLHEYLASTPAHQLAALVQPRIVVHHDGARAHDPDTYLKDIAVLQAALAEQPDNARNVYYLAQSLRDAGRLDEARTMYLRRAAMGGWDEEAWHALYQAAKLLDRLQGPPAEVQAAYLAAFEARPTRAEPLVELARHHRERQQHALAALVAQWAVAMPRPADRLFVEPAVYDWRALDELAVSGFYARSPELKTAGHAAMRRLMERIDALPDEVRARVRANAGFYDP
ncbi:glycosyltransferase [Ottowia sp.]|uniref:glycosyltransferase n=1 Tax=Ottowia sp. TaxID=1898956 RepID=UPI002CD0A594|nr:glycosyltransferase family 2 protein [Ottowia sp.]